MVGGRPRKLAPTAAASSEPCCLPICACLPGQLACGWCVCAAASWHAAAVVYACCWLAAGRLTAAGCPPLVGHAGRSTSLLWRHPNARTSICLREGCVWVSTARRSDCFSMRIASWHVPGFGLARDSPCPSMCLHAHKRSYPCPLLPPDCHRPPELAVLSPPLSACLPACLPGQPRGYGDGCAGDSGSPYLLAGASYKQDVQVCVCRCEGRPAHLSVSQRAAPYIHGPAMPLLPATPLWLTAAAPALAPPMHITLHCIALHCIACRWGSLPMGMTSSAGAM